MNFKVFMVDDHLMIIEGLKKQLATIPFIELIGYSSNPREVINFIKSNEIDILIFDYELPSMNGNELLVEIKHIKPEIKNICFTMHTEPWILQKLIKSGVDGIVLKTDRPDALNKAIATVTKGKKHIPHEVMECIIDLASNPLSNENLTDREVEVLRYIATELSTKEIANRMHLSENTIESYRKNLMLKLNAKNMAGLVLKGLQLGLIR